MTDVPEPGSTAVSPLRSSSHEVPSNVALAPSWCPSSCASRSSTKPSPAGVALPEQP